ncbi:hypothetical protein ACPJHQ_21785 [Rossellomorea sp. H39__3]
MNQFEKALEYLDYSLQLFEFYPDNSGGEFVREKELNMLEGESNSEASSNLGGGGINETSRNRKKDM